MKKSRKNSKTKWYYDDEDGVLIVTQLNDYLKKKILEAATNVFLKVTWRYIEIAEENFIDEWDGDGHVTGFSMDDEEIANATRYSYDEVYDNLKDWLDEELNEEEEFKFRIDEESLKNLTNDDIFDLWYDANCLGNSSDYRSLYYKWSDVPYCGDGEYEELQEILDSCKIVEKDEEEDEEA